MILAILPFTVVLYCSSASDKITFRFVVTHIIVVLKLGTFLDRLTGKISSFRMFVKATCCMISPTYLIDLTLL